MPQPQPRAGGTCADRLRHGKESPRWRRARSVGAKARRKRRFEAADHHPHGRPARSASPRSARCNRVRLRHLHPPRLDRLLGGGGRRRRLGRLAGALARHGILQRLNRVSAFWLADLHDAPPTQTRAVSKCCGSLDASQAESASGALRVARAAACARVQKAPSFYRGGTAVGGATRHMSFFKSADRRRAASSARSSCPRRGDDRSSSRAGSRYASRATARSSRSWLCVHSPRPASRSYSFD